MGLLLREIQKSTIEELSQMPGCLAIRFTVPIQREYLLYLTGLG